MINWIDVLIIGLLLFSAYQGYRRGFVIGVLGLIATAISVIGAILLTPSLSQLLANRFSFNVTITPLIVFFILTILLESIGSFVISVVDASVVQTVYKLKPIEMLDRILGVFPSLALAALFITLVMLVPITVPIAPLLRTDIQDSYWGKYVLPQAYDAIPKIEELAHQLPTKSLLYLIPQSPESEESVQLQLPTNLTLSTDEPSEMQMIALVNQERTSRGLKPLLFDPKLTALARSHSKDMFQRHYFSHVNTNGQSPFDRMDKAGIKYTTAGENLAYAPDVNIAHRGLMNSPGHRENILRPEFGHIGIGVIDAGIYGKMFSQEFTN